MDILAHGLWTYAIFHKKKYKWLAALFGVLPDILSFGPFLIYFLFLGENFAKEELLKPEILMAYNITHSLIVFIFVVLIVFLITKKMQWFMLGWGLHILIDIPTHTREFFPTPFLWPISDLKVNAISWSEPWFLIINYSALFIVYGYIFYKRKKK